MGTGMGMGMGSTMLCWGRDRCGAIPRAEEQQNYTHWDARSRCALNCSAVIIGKTHASSLPPTTSSNTLGPTSRSPLAAACSRSHAKQPREMSHRAPY